MTHAEQIENLILICDGLVKAVQARKDDHGELMFAFMAACKRLGVDEAEFRKLLDDGKVIYKKFQMEAIYKGEDA